MTRKSSARQQRQERRQTRRTARRTANTNEAPDSTLALTRKPEKRKEVVLNLATPVQKAYAHAIATARITFGIGPAGTGKTYVPCILALEALERGEIQKIYVTRPAVEAGESLGFLPGELDEKYAPYIRPLEDAMVEKLGCGHFEYLLKAKIIEPVPLGFLRGTTIKNSLLIADEMQNATKGQMKMLLTRIGEGTRFVITGDPKQVDISASESGLLDATKRLRSLSDVSIVQFGREDVVRDDVVAKILDCYEN